MFSVTHTLFNDSFFLNVLIQARYKRLRSTVAIYNGDGNDLITNDHSRNIIHGTTVPYLEGLLN